MKINTKRWLYGVLFGFGMSALHVSTTVLLSSKFTSDPSTWPWFVILIFLGLFILQARFLIFGSHGPYQNRVNRKARGTDMRDEMTVAELIAKLTNLERPDAIVGLDWGIYWGDEKTRGAHVSLEVWDPESLIELAPSLLWHSEGRPL